MDRLVATTEAAIADAGSDPAERLRAAVAAHVRFHIEFQRQSFVGNSELRSLTSTAPERVVRMRHHQRAIFDAVVASGIEGGRFSVPFPVEAARGLVTMCTAVATWYQRDGALAPAEIVDRNCALALFMVGHNHPQEEER